MIEIGKKCFDHLWPPSDLTPCVMMYVYFICWGDMARNLNELLECTI